MRKPQRGICCAGCPHRAAYVVVKDAMGRGRGRVICGEAGCPAVGELHPAATTCPGGQERLLPRYRQDAPAGSAEAPGADICAHFALDLQMDAAEAGGPLSAGALAGEGACAILCVMASSARFLTPEALDGLGRHLGELGYGSVALADPLDTAGTGAMLSELLAEGGVHAVVFASPCAQLMRGASPELATAAAEVDRISCVGCQRCVQIVGCPALSFRPPAASIDADVCAGCDLCADYCRTHTILGPRTGMAPAQKAALRIAAATDRTGARVATDHLL